MTTKSAKGPRSAAPRPRASRMTPEGRRDQLIQSALVAFSSKGIGAATHSDVAREAGVALATVFHYFPSRDDLTQAVTAEVSRFLLDEILEPYRDAALPAPEAIESVLLTFCDAIETHPDHVRIWLEWSVSVREGLWDTYLFFYRRALKGVETILETGAREGVIADKLDLADASRVIVGLAHMIVQMHFSGSPRDQIVHTVHSLVQGYLKAHH